MPDQIPSFLKWVLGIFIAVIIGLIIIPEFVFPPLAYVGMFILLLLALAVLLGPWLSRQRFGGITGGMTLLEWWEYNRENHKQYEKPKRDSEYTVGDDGELIEIVDETAEDAPQNAKRE